MKTETVFTKITCDACEEIMEKRITSTHEGLPTRISQIEYEGYYRGYYTLKDLCEKCNKKLVDFMIENKMLQFDSKTKNGSIK